MADENIEDKLKNTELPEPQVQTSPQTETIDNKLEEPKSERMSALEEKLETKRSFFGKRRKRSFYKKERISRLACP